MQYQKIPYVKKPVSRILFGTAMAPFTAGGDGNEIGRASCRERVSIRV